MKFTFRLVYLALKWLSALTGLTYNEINIVFYYFVVPLVLLLLIDRIFKKYIFFGALVAAWIALLLIVPSFSRFCDCAFDASVVFLNSFGFIGWNYIVASVMMCVVAPIIAFAVLSYLAFPHLFRRRSSTDVNVS